VIREPPIAGVELADHQWRATCCPIVRFRTRSRSREIDLGALPEQRRTLAPFGLLSGDESRGASSREPVARRGRALRTSAALLFGITCRSFRTLPDHPEPFASSPIVSFCGDVRGQKTPFSSFFLGFLTSCHYAPLPRSAA